MIAKVLKAKDTPGLLHYLFGPGRANEHVNQRVVAGSNDLQLVFGQLIPGGERLSNVEQRLLADKIDEHWLLQRAVQHAGSVPVRGADREGGAPHVVHAILSVKAEDDGELAEEKWCAIAADYIEAMQWHGCEWVAVHHGPSSEGHDHVHLVINRVRPDGSWASVYHDWKRSTEAARALEERHGLHRLHDHGDSRGMPGYSQGERRRAQAEGGPGERYILEQQVRVAATGARDEIEFLAGLRAAGVRVRPRYGSGGRESVVGYSVTMGSSTGEAPVWFSGGRLARDLTLPKLRARWEPRSAEDVVAAWRRLDRSAPQAEGAEYPGRALGDEPVQVAREATRLLQAMAREDARNERAWAAAAGDTAAWSSALGQHLQDPRLLTAARTLARSAQRPGGGSPPPRPVGVSRMIRQLMMAQSGHDLMGWMAVIEALGRASQAIADAHLARGELLAAQRVLSATRDIWAAVDDVAHQDALTAQQAPQRAASAAVDAAFPAITESPTQTPRPGAGRGTAQPRDHTRGRGHER
ncbi:hypothetical protein CGZ93_12585 [Enemella dayhoffiae]|uniref:MobA/VirD2-like nuclease domain-containing protein n=1 Tax=Enemella dayhoffiae TaxID=2016507 RepID=A0A255GY60_9ACTN|nr:relaxase/mobilization nuclease domain-containing protein [Enemella dayhoffiae]OYO19836.1 hypothetical protein CGZ93_12585 [Enemella dayhoffiae]